MKNAKIIITLSIMAILASIATGYGAGFFVYKEYKEKTAYLDEQAQVTMEKFGEIEGNLSDLYVSLDKDKIEREMVLAKIGDIKESVREWKRGYGTSLSELRKTIEDLKVDRLRMMVEGLQGEINDFKMTMQDFDLKLDEYRGTTGNLRANGGDAKSIDLGTISVRKQRK